MKKFTSLILVILIIVMVGCNKTPEINPSKFDKRTLTCSAYFGMMAQGMQNSNFLSPEQKATAAKDRDDYLYMILRKEHIIEDGMSDDVRQERAKAFNKLTEPEVFRLLEIYNTARDSLPTRQCMEHLFELEGSPSATPAPAVEPAPAPVPVTAPAPVSKSIGELCPTQVAPEMPKRALKDGVQGVVEAEITVSGGAVKNVAILSGPRVFHEAVKDAVMQYKCVADADNQEVVSVQKFTFKFE